MTPLSPPAVDAKRVHDLVLNRIYHEDLLLGQRTYNFLTFNVFLGALLAVGSSSGPTLDLAKWFAVVLGVLLATMQTAFGRRIEKAIAFWRSYLRLIERKENVPVDHMLFEFYNLPKEQKQVDTLWGPIFLKESNRQAMYRTFPWSWMPSTNTAIGVLLPYAVGSLWLLAAIVTTSAGRAWLALFPLGYWVWFTVFAWIAPLPATPTPDRPSYVPNRSGTANEGAA